MDKLILCLANSYKEGGRCIAGIEVELNEDKLQIVKSTFGIPTWIRPVSHSSAGQISKCDASGINVLSLVKIHNVQHVGSGSHSEDYYYSKLEFIQALNPSDSFLSKYTDTWHNNIFGNRGRALTPEAFQNGNYSIMLIRTEGSCIYLDQRFDKPRARIKFAYSGNQYDFPITDPEFLDKLHNNISLYKTYDVLYIVTSLAVLHEGWHSKLAATIIIPAVSNIKETIIRIAPKPAYTSPKPAYTPPKLAYTPYTPKKSSSNSGACYVATAIYGSYDCPEVWTLRRFRDYKLSKTLGGRAFVKIYYATSPLLVKYFGNTKVFQHMIKPILDRFVSELKEKGYKATPYKDVN